MWTGAVGQGLVTYAGAQEWREFSAEETGKAGGHGLCLQVDSCPLSLSGT